MRWDDLSLIERDVLENAYVFDGTVIKHDDIDDIEAATQLCNDGLLTLQRTTPNGCVYRITRAGAQVYRESDDDANSQPVASQPDGAGGAEAGIRESLEVINKMTNPQVVQMNIDWITQVMGDSPIATALVLGDLLELFENVATKLQDAREGE